MTRGLASVELTPVDLPAVLDVLELGRPPEGLGPLLKELGELIVVHAHRQEICTTCDLRPAQKDSLLCTFCQGPLDTSIPDEGKFDLLDITYRGSFETRRGR